MLQFGKREQILINKRSLPDDSWENSQVSFAANSCGIKVTPYSYLARGDWVLKWRERAQFSI